MSIIYNWLVFILTNSGLHNQNIMAQTYNTGHIVKYVHMLY